MATVVGEGSSARAWEPDIFGMSMAQWQRRVDAPAPPQGACAGLALRMDFCSRALA